jgi:molecular chaperone GrpE
METVQNADMTMSEDTQTTETNPSISGDASMHTPSADQDVTIEATVELESVDPVQAAQETEVIAEGEAAEALSSPEVPEGGSEEGVPAVDAEVVARLATEVESLRLQAEERTNQCVRIAADFDNFRKRTEREKGELELRVKRDAISELLPVIDSFERARTQIKPQTEQEVNIHKSYQGVYKQLVDCLKRVGVSPMRVEGQPFDPNYHDAIMREPTDAHEEGTIIEELRRGYLLGDLVLRHAMVKVAAPPEPAATTEPEADISIDDSPITN